MSTYRGTYYSPVTEGHVLTLMVMNNPENTQYGNFWKYEAEQLYAWNGGTYRRFTLMPIGTFFNFVREPASVFGDHVKETSGPLAKGTYIYSSSDLETLVDYWYDAYGDRVYYETGNGPYQELVHSEEPTGLDLSESGVNTIGIGLQGTYSSSYGLNSATTQSTGSFQTFTIQQGPVPVANTYLSYSYTSGGGLPFNFNRTDTFPTYQSSYYLNESSADRDFYTVSVKNTYTGHGSGRNPATSNRTVSGSFTRPIEQYFINA